MINVSRSENKIKKNKKIKDKNKNISFITMDLLFFF